MTRYFCILVLRKAWKVTQMHMQEISQYVVGTAHCFCLLWPTPENMFAYRHTSATKVTCEAADAFDKFGFLNGMGLGPSAMDH